MINNFQFDTVTNSILNMIIFDKIKIGNPIIDMIVTSIFLSLITILLKKLNNYYLHLKLDMINIADIFYKKKSDLATKISELNSEVLNKTTIFNDLKKSKH